MMIKTYRHGALAAICAVVLAGCANNDSPLTTGALTTPKTPAAKLAATKTKQACNALSAKIAGMRKEGTMARLAKVSTGKTRSTMVKRTSLAKAAQLDQANAEFQAKCTSYTTTTASVAAPAANAVKKATKAAAKTAVKKAVAKTAVKKAVAKTAVKKAVAKTAVKQTATTAATKAATTAVGTTAKKVVKETSAKTTNSVATTAASTVLKKN